mmetsp:Transcript_43544/g.114828  ORF Transcript_43544/g.114828 Transcript_43544/m.114828 type:complete len:344 (-) Transcript_43544:606-1637(-)
MHVGVGPAASKGVEGHLVVAVRLVVQSHVVEPVPAGAQHPPDAGQEVHHRQDHDDHRRCGAEEAVRSLQSSLLPRQMAHVQQPDQPQCCPGPRKKATSGVLLRRPEVQGAARDDVPSEVTEDVVHADLLEDSDDASRRVDEAAEEGEDHVEGHKGVGKGVDGVEQDLGPASELLPCQEAESYRHLQHVVKHDAGLDLVPRVPDLTLRRQHQPRQGVRHRPSPALVRFDRSTPAIFPLLLLDLLFELRHHREQLWKRHEVANVGLVEQLEHAVGCSQFLLLAQTVLEGDCHELCHLCGAEALPVIVELPKALRDAPLAAPVPALSAQEAAHVGEDADTEALLRR